MARKVKLDIKPSPFMRKLERMSNGIEQTFTRASDRHEASLFIGHLVFHAYLELHSSRFIDTPAKEALSQALKLADNAASEFNKSLRVYSLPDV